MKSFLLLSMIIVLNFNCDNNKINYELPGSYERMYPLTGCMGKEELKIQKDGFLTLAMSEINNNGKITFLNSCTGKWNLIYDRIEFKCNEKNEVIHIITNQDRSFTLIGAINSPGNTWSEYKKLK